MIRNPRDLYNPLKLTILSQISTLHLTRSLTEMLDKILAPDTLIVLSAHSSRSWVQGGYTEAVIRPTYNQPILTFNNSLGHEYGVLLYDMVSQKCGYILLTFVSGKSGKIKLRASF